MHGARTWGPVSTDRRRDGIEYEASAKFALAERALEVEARLVIVVR